MKLAPLLVQFWKYLPRFTDYFTETISISSLTATAGIATATSVGHGLSTGQRVNISGAVQISPVLTAIYDDPTGVLTVETTDNHGQLETFDFRTSLGNNTQPVTVVLEGFDQPSINGTFNTISVPDRKKFTCQVASGLGITPTGAGKVFNYAFNTFIGLKSITVTSVDTFTYAVDDTATLDASGTIIGHYQFRMQAAINSQRIFDSYTKQPQDKYVLFLTYGDEVVSKDRLVLNDANTSIRTGTRRRQRLIDSFKVIVIAPTSNEIAAVTARDSFDDIEKALFMTCLYLPADDRFSAGENFFFNFDSATDIAYNGAYLAREWTFQAQYDITVLDGFNDYIRIPMLDITGSVNSIYELNINLDEDS